MAPPIQHLIDSIGDIVQIFDHTGNFKFVNCAWREASGYDTNDIEKLRPSDLLAPSDEAKLRSILDRLDINDGPQPFEFQIRANTGSLIDLAGKITALPDSGNPNLAIGIFKKRQQPHCIESLSEFIANPYIGQLAETPSHPPNLSEISFDQTPIGICWADSNGNVLRCNKCLAGWLDSQPTQINSLDRFFPAGITPWRPQTEQEISVSDVPIEEKLESQMKSAGGRSFLTTIQVKRIRYRGANYQLIFIRDLTAESATDERVLKAQRLETVGVLAGGIAHDLNNTLLPIALGLDLLRAHANSKQTKLIDGMQASAQRASGLVKQMLMFAKRTELRLKPVTPGELLKELTKIITNTFPPNIHVDISSNCTDIHLIGDDVHLLRVLINLTLNARDAMPEGGILRVQAQEIEVDKIYAESIADGYPGKFVRFDVIDSGVGIAPEIIDRIYDPFFTTKGPDKGTGLGLSAVLGIVKGHRGFLKLYSTVGHGTRFSIYIPQVSRNLTYKDTPAEPASSQVNGRGLSALVVDDETFVREVLIQALEDLGFKVSAFEDGAKALNFAAHSTAPLSLLVTDLHMPHINGTTLVQAVRRRHGSIPVIVMSGRLNDHDRNNLIRIGVKEFLAKPFNQFELHRAINAVLLYRESELVKPPL